MYLRIRAATPGDARFLAWVIQEASRSHLPRGIWDLAVPEPEARADLLAELACAEPRSFSHWQGFLLAEIDARQVAALSGYEPGSVLPAWAAANEAAMDALGWSEPERADMGTRFESLGDVFPETPDDHWVVEWVATVPEFRGRGIVSGLLERILERGRERGYRKAQIGYLIGNEPAKRIYERAGFKTVSDKRDPDFEYLLGSPGIARMTRDL